MANPRQRRKAKSSTHKPVSHSKRAKRLQKKMPAIRGPKALQDAWDTSKTVRQNYLALGLQYDLNPVPSGGSEIHRSINARQSQPAVSSSALDDARSPVSQEPTVTCSLPKGFGRIVRDPSGNVIRVELSNDEQACDTQKRMEDVEIDSPAVTTESELRVWAPDRRASHGVEPAAEDDIVQDLEKLAASVTVRERHTSSGERLYLGRLVSRYGNDLSKMARDRRLNPNQRTANELRRAISRAGGFEALSKSTVTTGPNSQA